MSILVLLQILRQREGFLTVLALVIFAVQVNQVVSLKGELTREELLAVSNIALV
jgi:hypothetical protein